MRFAWRRTLRDVPFLVGGVLCGVSLLAAVFAGGLSPYPPDQPNYAAALQPPSGRHWLGTDEQGRDLFARTLYGARTSLAVAATAVTAAGLVGVSIGLFVAYRGGMVDEVVGRFVDALFAFPVVLLALLILAVLGPSQQSLVVAIATISVAQFVRVTRSATLTECRRDYVAASKVLGSSLPFILFRAILPNIAGTVFVLVSLGFAFAVLNETALSFLGLGGGPSTLAWGVTLSQGRDYLMEAPWYVAVPGMAVFLTVLGLNLLGDGLQHRFGAQRVTDGALTAAAATPRAGSPSPRGRGDLAVTVADAAARHQGLCIRDLVVAYGTGPGAIFGSSGVSLDIRPGEVLALVGESGCGKSTVGLAAAGLIEPPGRIVRGSVFVRGRDLVRTPPEELRTVRGAQVAMVFQEPMSSLNPSMTVGAQMTEMVRAHTDTAQAAIHERSMHLLDEVGLARPATVLGLYPHELSGGMCQRVMLAMAISLRPAVLIADEPTTALDVTTQARILRLLATLKAHYGLAILLITHDLGVARAIGSEIAVMYGGLIVEYGPAGDVAERPRHPYTKGLIASTPHGHWSTHRLAPIAGRPEQLHDIPAACPYRPRCPDAHNACGVLPVLTGRHARDGGAPRAVRCHLYEAADA